MLDNRCCRATRCYPSATDAHQQRSSAIMNADREFIEMHSKGYGASGQDGRLPRVYAVGYLASLQRAPWRRLATVGGGGIPSLHIPQNSGVKYGEGSLKPGGNEQNNAAEIETIKRTTMLRCWSSLCFLLPSVSVRLAIRPCRCITAPLSLSLLCFRPAQTRKQ